MIVEQISIFLENKAGRLVEVTRALAEAHINIRALSLADTSDFGILRVIVDDTEKAKMVLKERGLTVGRTNVVAVEVNDQPGGLDHILEVLSEKNINVEYMYAFVQRVQQRHPHLPFRPHRTGIGSASAAQYSHSARLAHLRVAPWTKRGGQVPKRRAFVPVAVWTETEFRHFPFPHKAH